MSMKESEVWLRLACAAVASFEPAEDLETLDEIAEATSDYAEAVADAMTDVYMDKFADEEPRRPARPAARPARPAARPERPARRSED